MLESLLPTIKQVMAVLSRENKPAGSKLAKTVLKIEKEAHVLASLAICDKGRIVKLALCDGKWNQLLLTLFSRDNYSF